MPPHYKHSTPHALSLESPVTNAAHAFSPYLANANPPQTTAFNTFGGGELMQPGNGDRNRSSSFGHHLQTPISTTTPFTFGNTATSTQNAFIPQFSPTQVHMPNQYRSYTQTHTPAPAAPPPPSITEPRKRQHRSPSSPSPSPSPSSSPDPSSAESPIIGHVLANKRFKCSSPSCTTLTFNRQADLRRHYENRHATRSRVEECYCPVKGCGRSYEVGGKRGRSFGMRRDKRDEHLRTVHGRMGTLDV
ncbi:hypothetical protein BDV96DRAFT_263020 [Lophiotrema nucula]|uniref:C2H2-type domain-containing protein n=1 Tax=Lophiotrema nucula TaxID=690887 RepID=A0A6A5YQ43_9PLEO|nr:hypothetical protein BDV96DRAFT_263020 [Lophiotrema nucula]